MTIDLSVDPELCIGSGECVRVAPAAFLLDEAAGVSVAVPAGVLATDAALIMQAARGCPTQAIQVVQDGVVVHASN